MFEVSLQNASTTIESLSYLKRDVESKIVKCKLCNLEMTYTGGTSNMLNHLKLTFVRYLWMVYT